MKIVYVKDGQSIWDLANQHYGKAEGVFSILEDNGLSLDSDLSSGQVIQIREGITDPQADYFTKRSRVINNTDFQQVEGLPLAVRLVEIGNVLRGNDGYVVIEVTGGELPYSFAWSNGQNGQNLVAVSEGNYGVIVTDENGDFVSLDTIIITADANEYLVDENGDFVIGRDGERIIVGYGR